MPFGDFLWFLFFSIFTFFLNLRIVFLNFRYLILVNFLEYNDFQDFLVYFYRVLICNLCISFFITFQFSRQKLVSVGLLPKAFFSKFPKNSFVKKSNLTKIESIQMSLKNSVPIIQTQSKKGTKETFSFSVLVCCNT